MYSDDRRLMLIYGVSSAAVGAGLMYLLDPDGGRRRRALIGDKMTRAVNVTEEAIGTTSRDAANRARGLWAEMCKWLRSEPVRDEVLAERVRARLGFLVSHPGSIGVAANEGRITLSGPVLAQEVDALISGVRDVPGVREVISHLDVHDQPGDISGLQGGGPPRRGRRWEFWQENWSPTARVLAGAAGAGLLLAGARQRGLPGLVLATAGLGLMTRGMTNLALDRLTGIGAGHRAVEITKTINIAAPVEKVFEFWTNYEQYPRFMANVRRVRMTEEGRSHWIVLGPANVPIEFNAVITRQVPCRELAWKTEPDSIVQHSGIVRFQGGPEGTTVHVRISYNPPGGAIGHGAAAMLGADVKSLMDEDLRRMKSVIETGKFPERENQTASGTPAQGTTGS